MNETAELIAQGLRDDGHVVEVASGDTRLAHALGKNYDVLVVDRMLRQQLSPTERHQPPVRKPW